MIERIEARLRLGRPRALVRRAVEPFAEVVAEGARDRAYRRRVLVLLTLTLGLDYADRAAVGALGPTLKHVFHISNTEFGFLASAFSVVGAVATLPAGVLVDRTRRTALLAIAIGLWTLAMAATGAATTFLWLIGARVFLGAVTAAARPALISISGDVFPTGVRGRALGLIDSGELIGDGVGFFLAGTIAAVLSWRGVFWVLGGLGVGVVYLVWRLPEPPRAATGRSDDDESREDDIAVQTAEEAPDVHADRRLVLRGDQTRMPFGRAVRYVLHVRTQVLVMVAVAIGSFFFAGLRTFAIVFVVGAYGVHRSVGDIVLLVAGLGAVFGIVAGGRIGDALIRGGRLNGRLVVASYSYLVAAAALVPAFLVRSLWLAFPSLLLGAASLAAPLPPLDAVRLDVIHPHLWGRAEAIRNVVLIVAEAGAPLLFGVLADHLAGGGTSGLRWTFMITLTTLVASAVILQVARRYYPRELSAVAASVG